MILGIDLGTTHSLVSVWRNGRVELIPNALGDYLTPSCVGLDEDGSILVGNAARDRLQTHPEKTASLFKRHMGSAKLERLGNISYRPEELSSLVLRALKEDAETFLGTSITEAVITVPAYFSDSQRKATRSAGQLAGLKVDRLLSEPTAAALAYGLHEAGDEAKFLVFDLGGGTFDVSIIEKFDGVMEVRAAAGDNFLGGEDFTMVIVEFFYRNSGIAEAARHDVAFQHRLTAQAEATKRALSQRKSDTLSVVWRDAAYAVTLTDEQLAALSQDLLTRLRVPVERALRDARIRAMDIDSVVLAGGATRMPLIRQLVARMFGRFPHTEVHPDEVVAAGAAVMAGLKMKDAALDEIVMTDVCPYTLSTEVSRRLDDGSLLRGLSSPIIERNTIVPASRVETFYPTEDGQQSLMFGIYQGESRYAKDNIKLGELSVGIAKGPRSEGAVDIRFTYDVNGLLEVETRVHKTGKTDRLLIKSQGDGLSDSEVEERLRALADLKIHPRDRMENRSLQAQAERQFQQLLGPLRDKLGDEIARFEAALAQQDNRASRLASERLRKIMAAIDGDTYFAPDFD